MRFYRKEKSKTNEIFKETESILERRNWKQKWKWILYLKPSKNIDRTKTQGKEKESSTQVYAKTKSKESIEDIRKKKLSFASELQLT